MFSTPPANPASAKPRRAASSSGRPAGSVNENARPRASTHWIRSGTTGPGCSTLRIVSTSRFRDGIIGRDDLEQPPRLKLVANQPFRNLAVAGFGQRFPEEETLRHLVARHLRGQERRQLRFADSA